MDFSLGDAAHAALRETYTAGAVGIDRKQMLLMQRESAKLDRQFKLIEQTYGNDHLDLVLVNGYVAKLVANARIVKFLTQHYAEILTEFQRIVDVKSAAA